MDCSPLEEELSEARREIQFLRQTLELTRMSLALIMARPGCSLELDRVAKESALKHIEEGLSYDE